MKKIEENRYPHSATLFKFCKQALEMRYDGNVKVIDQDVGAILGYDPADCSHWKKGKKNIRALSTLKSIADHLNIDERLLIDIAAGKINLEEAIFEYRGYGAFTLSGRNLENIKKEFFKNPGKWQQEGALKSFEELFSVDRERVIQVADKVIETGNFTEAPIYIPEVYQLYPNIHLKCDQEMDQPIRTEIIPAADGSPENQVTNVFFRGPEMRPYIRFLLAKELFKHLCRVKHRSVSSFVNCPDEVVDIQSNIFAGALLIPATLLKNEVDKIDASIDLVKQLAETFWVSNALMNQRLCEFMENLS